MYPNSRVFVHVKFPLNLMPSLGIKYMVSDIYVWLRVVSCLELYFSCWDCFISFDFWIILLHFNSHYCGSTWKMFILYFKVDAILHGWAHTTSKTSAFFVSSIAFVSFSEPFTTSFHSTNSSCFSPLSRPHSLKNFFWNPTYPIQYRFTSNIQNSFPLENK